MLFNDKQCLDGNIFLCIKNSKLIVLIVLCFFLLFKLSAATSRNVFMEVSVCSVIMSMVRNTKKNVARQFKIKPSSSTQQRFIM